MAAWSAVRLSPSLPTALRRRLSRAPVWRQVDRLWPRPGRPAHAVPAQAELRFRPFSSVNPLDQTRLRKLRWLQSQPHSKDGQQWPIPKETGPFFNTSASVRLLQSSVMERLALSRMSRGAHSLSRGAANLNNRPPRWRSELLRNRKPTAIPREADAAGVSPPAAPARPPSDCLGAEARGDVLSVRGVAMRVIWWLWRP
jgi:hypothetical protein